MIRVDVAIFGAICGSVRVLARSSPHDLDKFVYYVGVPENGHEWLYGSEDAYIKGRAVALHDPGTAESLRRSHSPDTIPWEDVPPVSPQV